MFLLVVARSQIMQMPTRQRQKTRRRADVFIQRIAFFVRGDHRLAFHIRKARFQLLQCSTDQFAEQLFPVAFWVHFGDSGQSRSGFHVQMNFITRVGQATLGVFFPVLG